MRPGSEYLASIGAELAFPHVSDMSIVSPEWPMWILGSISNRPVAVTAAPDTAVAPYGMEWRSIRSLYSILEPCEVEAMSRAAMLVSWYHFHQFCGSCGMKNKLDAAETALVCFSCGFRVYPRISPSMIVRITHEERILLARRFTSSVYSCVAGYVEPGETLERTVLREIKEEVGLDAYDPVYISSQSWPFPNSLMMAFSATAKGEPVPDGVEIMDARWFNANDLPHLPQPGSIAHELIRLWLEDLR